MSGQTVFHVLFGVFVLLHGIVHLLYAGHSARLWELKPGLDWPDGSWAFSTWLGDRNTRRSAGVVLLVVAAAFAVGGVGAISHQSWWRPLVVAAAAVSIGIYCLVWDGSRRNLDGQGAVGLLISVAVLAVVLLVQ
jgi:hypothetical protein